MQKRVGGDEGSGPMLQRKESFSLLSSSETWLFSGKKRKQRTRDVDSLSLCSLDINEPSSKRVKPLSRVTSLASLLPPVKAAPLKRIGQTLQRSISFRNDCRPEIIAPRPWSRQIAPAITKRRDSKLWSETFDVGLGHMLSSKEIKRQEAIFELSQGEQDLIEDLKLAKKLPCLETYATYCSNQVAAKALLDHKKQDHRVHDFLQRCLESPFSRKLDLWSFLDIPRSRLVKYPLLLREILKHTASEHPDRQHLHHAMSMIQSIVAHINTQTGESECRYYKERLLYLESGQRDLLIDSSRILSCHGPLKNNRGLKLHVFLFQDVLVVTRAVSQNEQLCYQLHQQPIPVRDLEWDDLQDGEMRLGGSIRGAFSNSERTKNFFRVVFGSGGQLQTLCFQASDAFSKQQWLNCIRQAKEAVCPAGSEPQLLSVQTARQDRARPCSDYSMMDTSDACVDLSIECPPVHLTDVTAVKV
ncbi:rho guanine nucleotide exchange factor 3 isoform X6 [Carassius auratus]|uniref:Rho guanine nucleotide exchange factor 3 n=1 Tax=Carassius auratus TaxID=7957 RepID=A0A6P6M7P3_CARAU|nr:rho guanine nucleotide exchange factor 3-like isoform X6 [Carassius auratus]